MIVKHMKLPATTVIQNLTLIKNEMIVGFFKMISSLISYSGLAVYSDVFFYLSSIRSYTSVFESIFFSLFSLNSFDF